MMNNELLMQALSERRAFQEKNRVEEERRAQAVSQAHPDIGLLVKARREAIFAGLRQAMQGKAPEQIEEVTQRNNQQIEELLLSYGYGSDYLAPLHDCPLCRDTGYAGSSRKTLCRCVALRYQALLNGAASPQENQTFENYDDSVYPQKLLPGTQTSQRAYTRWLREQCETWADALPETPRKALLLFGKSGLGKTYLLRCVGERAASRGVQTLILTANTLLNQIRKQYFSRDTQEDPLYRDIPLLLIDDLGTEPLWENITVEQLFALLDYRLARGLHTLISTNLSLTELKARYTERISSRLMDDRVCQRLQFLGEDVRLRSL
ncbi:MAG: ATP-binding protein [Christensenellales bacterium]